MKPARSRSPRQSWAPQVRVVLIKYTNGSAPADLAEAHGHKDDGCGCERAEREAHCIRQHRSRDKPCGRISGWPSKPHSSIACLSSGNQAAGIYRHAGGSEGVALGPRDHRNQVTRFTGSRTVQRHISHVRLAADLTMS